MFGWNFVDFLQTVLVEFPWLRKRMNHEIRLLSLEIHIQFNREFFLSYFHQLYWTRSRFACFFVKFCLQLHLDPVIPSLQHKKNSDELQASAWNFGFLSKKTLGSSRFPAKILPINFGKTCQNLQDFARSRKEIQEKSCISWQDELPNKFLASVLKTNFNVSRGTFLSLFFLQEKQTYVFFRTSIKKFCLVSSKLTSTCPVNNLGENFVLQLCFFVMIWALILNLHVVVLRASVTMSGPAKTPQKLNM